MTVNNLNQQKKCSPGAWSRCQSFAHLTLIGWDSFRTSVVIGQTLQPCKLPGWRELNHKVTWPHMWRHLQRKTHCCRLGTCTLSINLRRSVVWDMLPAETDGVKSNRCCRSCGLPSNVPTYRQMQILATWTDLIVLSRHKQAWLLHT